MKDRVTTVEEALGRALRSGQTVMVGGFGRGGTPHTMLEWLADRPERYRDLVLVKNDASEPHLGVGLLLAAGMVRRLVATHVGLNPAFIAQMNAGEVEAELVPQGIFAERIRAGGAGLGGVLSDVGLGTRVAHGKPTVALDGPTYLVERALRGDLALLRADLVDRAGNCFWRGSNRNMCVAMGTACDRVVVEAERIVEVGAVEPERVHLPALFVDAVVPAREPRHVAAERQRRGEGEAAEPRRELRQAQREHKKAEVAS